MNRKNTKQRSNETWRERNAQGLKALQQNKGGITVEITSCS